MIILLGLVYFNNSKNEEGIRIGVLYASTGPASVYGEISIKGVNDAISYFEEKENMKVNAIFEDTKGDPTTAVTAINKMISVDNINYFVTGTSAITNAVSPITETNKKILITDAAAFGLTKDKNYLFQNLVPSLNDVPKNLLDEEYKKISLVYINDYFGNIWANNIYDSLSENTGISVMKHSFSRDTTDYRTESLKIKDFSPDAIVVIGYPPSITQVLVDLNLQKIEAKKFIYLACTLPGIVSDERYSLDSDYSYEYPSLEEDLEIVSWLVENLVSNYENTFYVLAFENTLVLLNAIKEADDKGPQEVREVLLDKTFSGIYGDISFDGKNYFERDLEKKQISGRSCV